MWVFTESGFVSAVCTSVDSNTLRVRARDRQSLEGIAAHAGVEIDRSPERDYPYRVELTKTQWAAWLADQAGRMSYGNFKDRVHKTRGHEFAYALLKVWSAMHEVEDAGARS